MTLQVTSLYIFQGLVVPYDSFIVIFLRLCLVLLHCYNISILKNLKNYLLITVITRME